MTDRVVWKFPLVGAPVGALTTRPVLTMPEGARILTVQFQGEGMFGTPCLWALVDPSRPTVERQFVIVGTGLVVPDEAGDYVGTWQQSSYVFHVFEAR